MSDQPKHVLAPDESAELDRRFAIRGQMHIVLQEVGAPGPDWDRIAQVLRTALEVIEAAE